MLRTYSLAKKRNQTIELEALDAVAKIKLEKLKIEVTRLELITLKFPENKYNKLLQQKFAQLDRVTTDALNVLASGSGEGIISSYKILVASYDKMTSDITRFTPTGKSLGYIKGFKDSMKRLVEPISKKAREFRTEANRQISRSSILSSSDFSSSNSQ